MVLSSMMLHPCQGHPCWTCPSFPSGNPLWGWLGRGAAAGPRVAPLPRGPERLRGRERGEGRGRWSGERAGSDQGRWSGERGPGAAKGDGAGRGPGEAGGDGAVPAPVPGSQPAPLRALAPQLGRGSRRALSSSTVPGARARHGAVDKGQPGLGTGVPAGGTPCPAGQGQPSPRLPAFTRDSPFRSSQVFPAFPVRSQRLCSGRAERVMMERVLEGACW